MSNSSMNATKHGCCAVDARLLPGESEKEYRNLERLWIEAYNPKNDSQRHMVMELVNADWLLQRATRTHLEIESKLFAKSTNPLDWTVEEQRTLGRFQRYKTAAANHMARCKKAIEDFRRYQLTLELNEERLKAVRKKNDTKPASEMSWKEHLAQMRQQAIALGYTPPDQK